MELIKIVFYLIAGIAVLSIFLGFVVKLFMMLVNILSIPVYIGLMYAEDIPIFSFFKINKPPKNWRLKFIMNSCASCITIVVVSCIYEASRDKLLSSEFVRGEILTYTKTIIIVICLVVFYTINRLSPKDTSDNFEKIDKLDIVPFLKLWI